MDLKGLVYKIWEPLFLKPPKPMTAYSLGKTSETYMTHCFIFYQKHIFLLIPINMPCK